MSKTKEQKFHNLSYLIQLAAAAINDTRPPEPDDEVSFESVYKVSKLHDIANTLFYAVEKLNKKPDGELYKKWRDERNMGVHRYMIQTMEAQALRETFNENEVDFMPIKGFPVCELYPAPDYRYMGDLDYLIREEDLKKAGALVKNMGYMPDEVGKFHHDEYKKPPLMVLELHHKMVRATSRFRDYYEDFLDKGENVGGHEYKMSDEDFYIFQLVHLNKHYEDTGIGVRAFMDMYLLNKKWLPKLDMDYVNAELGKLELTEFFSFVKDLTEKWFERVDVRDFSEDELYIITSGVYGREEYRTRNRLKNKTKAQVIREKMFPPVKWMKDIYPILRKNIVLLPFMYIHRLVTTPIKKRKDIKYEIREFRKTDDSKS